VTCNRLRVSAVCKLHLCLFGENGIPLRDLLEDDSQQEALQQRIQGGLLYKRETHFLHQGDTGVTPNLSVIGG
ncbi:GTP 3',8-cyclase MoaA, partial [Pseudomonas aeruginosa]